MIYIQNVGKVQCPAPALVFNTKRKKINLTGYQVSNTYNTYTKFKNIFTYVHRQRFFEEES